MALVRHGDEDENDKEYYGIKITLSVRNRSRMNCVSSASCANNHVYCSGWDLDQARRDSGYMTFACEFSSYLF